MTENRIVVTWDQVFDGTVPKCTPDNPCGWLLPPGFHERLAAGIDAGDFAPDTKMTPEVFAHYGGTFCFCPAHGARFEEIAKSKGWEPENDHS